MAKDDTGPTPELVTPVGGVPLEVPKELGAPLEVPLELMGLVPETPPGVPTDPVDVPIDLPLEEDRLLELKADVDVVEGTDKTEPGPMLDPGVPTEVDGIELVVPGKPIPDVKVVERGDDVPEDPKGVVVVAVPGVPFAFLPYTTKAS